MRLPKGRKLELMQRGWGKGGGTQQNSPCELVSHIYQPLEVHCIPILDRGACFVSPTLGMDQQWSGLEKGLVQSYRVSGFYRNSTLEF